MFNKEWTSLAFSNGSQALSEIFSEYSVVFKFYGAFIKEISRVIANFWAKYKTIQAEGSGFYEQTPEG